MQHLGAAINYYERHLGDYARDAGHLSMLEHGAYCLLLDRYYITEQGIPADQAQRLCRAKSKDERAAVDAVLAEFFTLDGGLWVNGRAEREVIKAQAKINAARENGKSGGRPRLTKPEPTGLPLGSDSVTQQKALQTPDTIKDISNPTGSQPPAKADSPKTPAIPCPYDRIVASYHEHLPSLPSIRLMPVKRQAALRKFWGWVLTSRKSDGTRRAEDADGALAWISMYFAKAADSDFLMGRGARVEAHAGWQCDMDFLLTDKGLKHVIERSNDTAQDRTRYQPEPDWRREQREQTEAFAGSAAVKRPTHRPLTEIFDVAAKTLG